MDITILFKACVKTLRTTNRNLGIKEDKTNILRISRDVNLIKAREIIKHIVKLHNFIMENRLAYLNVVNYLSTNKTMTEIDRQEVDIIAQKIITTCSAELNAYRISVKQQSNSKQKLEHYCNVGDSIEKYLKYVSKIYTEAKAIRVKRVLEAHKLSKLETKSTTDKSTSPVKSKVDDNKLDNDLSKRPPISLPSPLIENVENQLTSEELQMFESENELLFDELNSLSEEVKQIESKVVHISELQELFTEKVLQQEQDIERIASTVAASTDDIKDANEQIRHAIQRNAGLRVWILFFLLVMSFSLLFLDWYND